MPQVRPRPVFPLAARTCLTLSERITWPFASSTALNDLHAGVFTILSLAYFNSLTDLATIYAKADNTTIYAHPLYLTGTAGDLRGTLDFATTDANYATNDTPVKIGRWTWIAMSWDTSRGAGERIHFYTADTVLRSWKKRTVTVTAEPAGAVTSDSSRSPVIMQQRSSTGVAFNGHLALVTIWNRLLSMQTLEHLANNPHLVPRSDPTFLVRPGWQNRCMDEAGAYGKGTETGVVLASSVWPRL